MHSPGGAHEPKVPRRRGRDPRRRHPVATGGSAGPEKIAFPAGWEKFVLYNVVDRYDNKQYRELYASTQEAVDAAKAGKPLPNGTVLVLAQYKAQVDAQGNPVKDAKGRFVKGDPIALTVMEKRAGWGTEYPDDLRNGEWEYAAFSLDGKLNTQANYKACFQCHKPHEKLDFVISYSSIAGQMAAALPATAPATDVTIQGFVVRPEQAHRGPGQDRDVGQHRRLAPPGDGHRAAALAAPDEGPEPHPGLRGGGCLRVHLWPAPRHEGDRRGQVAPAGPKSRWAPGSLSAPVRLRHVATGGYDEGPCGAEARRRASAAGPERGRLDMDLSELRAKIRDIKDFPTEGILFKDITTLLKDPKAFKCVLDELATGYIQARRRDRRRASSPGGSSSGAPWRTSSARASCRSGSSGSFPAKTISVEYELEYGRDALAMHEDAIAPGQRILVVDDLLATGGTMAATLRLVEQSGGVVVGLAFLIELAFLHGRAKLKNYPMTSLIVYE